MHTYTLLVVYCLKIRKKQSVKRFAEKYRASNFTDPSFFGIFKVILYTRVIQNAISKSDIRDELNIRMCGTIKRVHEDNNDMRFTSFCFFDFNVFCG